MPPRLDLLKHCWSSVDLPILPFLAPRVFQPWPVRSQRRLRSAARGAVRYQSDLAVHGYNECWNGFQEVQQVRSSAESSNPLSRDSNGAATRLGKQDDGRNRTQLEVNELPEIPSPTAETSTMNSLEGEEFGKLSKLELLADLAIRREAQFITWASIMSWVEWERPGMNPRLKKPARRQSLGSPMHPTDVLDHFPPGVLDLTAESIIEAWEESAQKVTPVEKQNVWKILMGITLARHPTDALDVLEAISYEGVPLIAISDVIGCFVEIQFRNTEAKTDFQTLTKRIFQICQRFPGLRLYNHTSRRMLSQLPGTDFAERYNWLEQSEIEVNFDTLHYIAYRLAKEGNTDLAFHILRKIRHMGVDFNEPKVLSLVSSILHHARDRKESKHQPAAVFEFVSGCDMIPNIITYNILILSTISSGDPDTAWKIHDMIVEIGIETDAFTYSILFHDAKQRRDFKAIEAVRNLVRSRGVDNHVILTDELHLMHLSSVDAEESSLSNFGACKTFDNMLSFFSQHFELSPLRRILTSLAFYASAINDTYLPLGAPEITIPLPFGTPETSTARKLHIPDAPAIGVMVSSFLRTCQSSHLRQFYQHFRSMVLAGDPVCKDLLGENPYLYNMILLAYSRHQDLWGEAPSIVADMLSGESQVSKEASTPPQSPDLASDPPKPHIPPQPTAWTWSILLFIFMRQGLPSAAEKVLSMMTRRGVKPSKVTWNILLHGYARLKDPKMAADTVARLQEAGHKVDREVFDQMNHITDRAGLQRAMQARGLTVDKDFMSDLQNEVVKDVLSKRRRRR